MQNNKYQSIFSPSTAEQRQQNFESYWVFTTRHAGQLLEEDKDLTNKRARLKFFQDNPVRSRMPLADPQRFYRNY